MSNNPGFTGGRGHFGAEMPERPFTVRSAIEADYRIVSVADAILERDPRLNWPFAGLNILLPPDHPEIERVVYQELFYLLLSHASTLDNLLDIHRHIKNHGIESLYAKHGAFLQEQRSQLTVDALSPMNSSLLNAAMRRFIVLAGQSGVHAIHSCMADAQLLFGCPDAQPPDLNGLLAVRPNGTSLSAQELAGLAATVDTLRYFELTQTGFMIQLVLAAYGRRALTEAYNRPRGTLYNALPRRINPEMPIPQRLASMYEFCISLLNTIPADDTTLEPARASLARQLSLQEAESRILNAAVAAADMQAGEDAPASARIASVAVRHAVSVPPDSPEQPAAAPIAASSREDGLGSSRIAAERTAEDLRQRWNLMTGKQIDRYPSLALLRRRLLEGDRPFILQHDNDRKGEATAIVSTVHGILQAISALVTQHTHNTVLDETNFMEALTTTLPAGLLQDAASYAAHQSELATTIPDLPYALGCMTDRWKKFRELLIHSLPDPQARQDSPAPGMDYVDLVEFVIASYREASRP